MKHIIPPKLKKGDEVRVIAPSRSLALVKEERFEEAITYKKKETDLKTQLQQLEQRATQSEAKQLGTLQAEDIATVIARITKVPVTELLQAEKEKLLHLADYSTL